MAVEREITSDPSSRPDGASSPAGNSPVRRKKGLLDLKTDLKSLKYSQFGVNIPVTKDINDPPSYNSASQQGRSRTDDLVRITKFLASGNGLKFAAKQGLLSQVNQNRGGSVKDRLKASLKSGAVNTAKVLASTLAQVPAAGTGLHFVRGFGGYSYLSPGIPASDLPGILGTIQNFGQNNLGLGGGLNGAQNALAGTQIILDYEGGDNFTPQAPDELLDKVKDEGAKFNPTFADSNKVDEETYLGNSRALGPQRLRTSNPVIRDARANESSPRNVSAERQDEQDGSLRSKVNPNSTGRQVESDLSTLKRSLPQTARSAEAKGPTELTNFVQTPNTQTKAEQRPEAVDYGKKSLTVRSKTGDQGVRTVRNDIKNKEEGTVDKLNASEVLPKNSSEPGFFEPQATDIIPFEIEVISPESRQNRYNQNNFIYFRAHLDSFSDDYSGNWNETKYVGRAEPMYTYDGFNRSVSFSFKIAAFTREELLPLYRKLNFLASSTGPTYSGTGAFMRGTFSRLTIGDYIYETPGFFGSIGISWEVNYPWEINLEDDDSIPVVPHLLDVSCNFTPVHNFIPALNQPFLMKQSFYTNG